MIGAALESAQSQVIDPVVTPVVTLEQLQSTLIEIEQNYSGSDDWPDPDPTVQLTPVQNFDLDLLPVSLKAWVADVAMRQQVPVDLVAVTALMALAAVVGRRALIQPKKLNSWVVVPNLWGLIIAPPSRMKSPVIAEIFKPIRSIEKSWRQEHGLLMEKYEEEKERRSAGACIAIPGEG